MGNQPSTTVQVGHLGVEPKDPPAPKAGVLPSAPLPDVVCRASPRTISVGAYRPCQWAGRRSNPRLRFFRPPLDRLSYQPNCCWWRRARKKARCRVTPGLDERRFERSRCHMRKRYAGASLFDGVPPKRLPSHICSSRLDWNFDNMELSALACEALNCRVQRVRRETCMGVREKTRLNITTISQHP